MPLKRAKAKKATKAPKKKKLLPVEDWHYCHSCNLARGAKVPKGGMGCITVMRGECSGCGLVATLIPVRDYNYPGKPAWFD